MAASDRAALREALVDQLEYLIDEVELLRGIAARIPETIQTGRALPDALTLRETYGLIALLDETVRLPRFERTRSEDEPAFEDEDEAALLARADFNAVALPDLIDRLRAARTELVAFLRSLPPDAWARSARFTEGDLDVYGQVQRIIQGDMERLQTLGQRLFEVSGLGRR